MLQNQKHVFNLDDNCHYLNCAYKAPYLKQAEIEVNNALKQLRTPIGLTPSCFFEDAETVKALFAKLIHVPQIQVALIGSTSYGLANVFNNIGCKNGQHALVVSNEFPSDIYAVKKWCDYHNAELKTIKPDANLTTIGSHWNDKILSNITSKTAVVNLSSVHWTNGIRFDLKAIGEKCKLVGAKFIVDGTQSVGATPINAIECHIDAIICAGYKWLFGAYSLGAMYISESFNNGSPIEESWMNRENATDFKSLTNYTPNYGAGANRYNIGEISNFLSMPVFKTGLSQLLKWDVKCIDIYNKNLIKPLKNYCKSIGIAIEDDIYSSNHILGINLPSQINKNTFQQLLIESNIHLSNRDNAIRVSVNVFNTKNDIDTLIDVFKNALHK